ncbi:unnamed protein product [Bubo scandiacus]
MATELDDRCPICLDSWEEASFVMPCLHQFCYLCILRWAESKPECPLCKRTILSILHSVRADDDYVEHVVTPSRTPSVIVRQAGAAPGHPAARDLRRPGAPQPRAAEQVPRHLVGGLQPEQWVTLFRSHPTLLETLQPWVQPRLRRVFRNNRREAHIAEQAIMSILINHGMDEEMLVRTLEVSLQNHTATFVQEFFHVAVHRCSREARRLLSRQEGSPVGAPDPTASRGGSPAPVPAPSGSPARPSTDELPGTSSAAIDGSPSSHSSAPIAIPVEQEEPQEEPGEAVPGPSTSSWGTEHSPGGPRRPPKRRASSTEASPANKRPARRQ